MLHSETNLRRATERVHHQTESALTLLDWLDVEGLIALSVTIEHERRPLVSIGLSPKCTWLKTHHKAYVHSRSPNVVTWRCDLMGCRVQWLEGGH
ncbi:MAG: hypothetical protein LBE24_10500 [Methylobacillus sp.]|jgi:hypothetical protein|nr:hypothetical protein [Methylobacillus sp.]